MAATRRTTTPGAAGRGTDVTLAGGGVPRARAPLPTRVTDLPALPASYDAALDAGLDSLGLSLEPAVRSAIGDHVRLLLAWTAAINLTGIRDPEAVAREHVVDSLLADPLFRARGVRGLLDLGSGGGYPGIPLALSLGSHASLVDSVAKKTRFLETAVHAVGAAGSIRVILARAEELAAQAAHRETWPAVTARAVARLVELAEIGLPLVRPGGILVAWKRLPMDEELAEADRAIGLLGGGRVDVTQNPVPGLEDHVLVVVEKRSPSPSVYPRDPARRRSRPLA